MRILFFLIFLLLWIPIVVWTQGFPNIQSRITIDLPNIGAFELFPDSQGVQILYVKPANLKIARGSDGKPMISIILLKEIVTKAEPDSIVKTKAWGYIWLNLYLGYDKQEEVFKKLHNQIGIQYPHYKNWNLNSISLLTGTGKIGYSIADSKEIVWIPFPAPTTIGSQMPVMIPIPQEHAEIIRQKLLKNSQLQGNDLGIVVHYQADVTFALPPTKMWVKAEKREAFNYVHEVLKSKGGFFIFSWSYHREKIREELERNQIIKGEIEGLQPFQPEILALFNEMKNRAIDFTAMINVDRSRSIPDTSFEKREGHSNIFGSWHFWNFTAWAEGAYGSINKERIAQGTYDEEYNFKGITNCSVSMFQENVLCDTSVIKEIDLNNAFYVADLLVAEPFFNASVWGKWVESAKIIVNIGEADSHEKLVFHFNQNFSRPQASAFWRNAYFKWEGSFVHAILPKLYVHSEITTPNLRLRTPILPYERTVDKFRPNTIELSDFYGLVKIDASLIFPQRPDIKAIQVQYLRPGIPEGQEILNMTMDKATAYAVYDKSKGIKETAIRTRAITVNGIIGPWGNLRKVSGESEIFIVMSDIQLSQNIIFEYMPFWGGINTEKFFFGDQSDFGKTFIAVENPIFYSDSKASSTVLEKRLAFRQIVYAYAQEGEFFIISSSKEAPKY